MHRPPWPAVEFRHLAALSAVAREGSFRAAADDLGYVQSAVSEQIAALETSIGTSVIERRRGAAPAALTEAGELLLRHFEQIIDILATADAELDALREGRRGRLRIGVYESVAVRILPSVLRDLMGTLPDVKVELVASSNGDGLADLVACGHLDAAFGNLPRPAWSFASRELMSDPHVLMAPAEWALTSGGRAPTAAQLRTLTMIGPASGKRAQLAEAQLRARGVTPRYAFAAEGNSALQALVGAGMGAAVVPRLSVDAADERIALLDLSSFVSPRPISLFWPQDRVHPALETFTEIVARGCARHSETVVHVAPLAA
jgi:molybdate transport repressor ModE-like protein